MQKSISRSAEQAKLDGRGYRIIAGCVFALGVGGVLVVVNQAPGRDKVSACVHGPLTSHVLTIIDRTDFWAPADRALLRSSITKLADTTPIEARLTLTPFSGGADIVPEPAFDRCRPAAGADVNPIFSTTAKADKLFSETFGAPLATKIDELTREVVSAQSTNLVQFIGTNAGMGFQGNATRKRMRIFSDMAEHTASGSFLGKHPFTPASFTTYFNERVGERLKGVELEIVVTPSASTPAVVARRIKEAWTAALTAKGISFTWERL